MLLIFCTKPTSILIIISPTQQQKFICLLMAGIYYTTYCLSFLSSSVVSCSGMDAAKLAAKGSDTGVPASLRAKSSDNTGLWAGLVCRGRGKGLSALPPLGMRSKAEL